MGKGVDTLNYYRLSQYGYVLITIHRKSAQLAAHVSPQDSIDVWGPHFAIQ